MGNVWNSIVYFTIIFNASTMVYTVLKQIYKRGKRYCLKYQAKKRSEKLRKLRQIRLERKMLKKEIKAKSENQKRRLEEFLERDQREREERIEKTKYIENLVNDKNTVMKKIHKVTYSDIFGPNFNSIRIDNKFVDLTVEEKLRLVDHVIDYVYVNFEAIAIQNTPITVSDVLMKRQFDRKLSQATKRAEWGLSKSKTIKN